MTIRIGTAGWSLYRAGEAFPTEGTVLERYAARMSAVEINTSFYRPHQRKTYERWAASTPEDFRFAVKVPQAITHERRLIGVDDLLSKFLYETGGLGAKRGPLLIQLPPSLAFEAERGAGVLETWGAGGVDGFLETWRARTAAPAVLEPRHASWFEAEADTLLVARRVARVAADPAVVPFAAEPGASSTTPASARRPGTRPRGAGPPP